VEGGAEGGEGTEGAKIWVFWGRDEEEACVMFAALEASHAGMTPLSVFALDRCIPALH
jgi:hypothetical protein